MSEPTRLHPDKQDPVGPSIGGPSLVRKLAAVMGEVERIPKSGRNDFHKYDYATEADIVAAVRKGLSERGVMIVHKVDSLTWREPVKRTGEVGSPIATVHVTFSAIDGDSGEVLVVAQTVGEGQDSGDKAVYKALTGALKYAILKLFLIPTGHDPEASKKVRPTESGTATSTRTSSGPPAQTGAPTTFPNYGRNKGGTISGATGKDLEFYLDGARKELADPEKARFHAKASALIGAIEAELARQKTGGVSSTAPAPRGNFYDNCLKLGASCGWGEKDVKDWLAKLGRKSSAAVTADDVLAFEAHLVSLGPPPETQRANEVDEPPF